MGPGSPGPAASSPGAPGDPAHGSRSWLRAAIAVATFGWGAQQFTPLLLMYQERLGLSATLVQATFVPYVVGLIPGLLFGGPCSDRFGRRKVMVPTVLASAVATVLLISGGGGTGWLFAGRLVSGMASGAGFSCGGAWIKELSTATGGVNHGPRRLTVAMGFGFMLGPLLSGALAQWAPGPTVTPYLPHLLLCAVAFAAVLRTPETLTPKRGGGFVQYLRIHEVRHRRFTTVVVPLAPWVFIVAAIAAGYLPGLVKDQISGYPLIFSAAVVVANAGAGNLVLPFARRINRPGTSRLLLAALLLVVAGLLVAAAAAALTQPVLVLLAAVVLGGAYGCCQIYGLLEVQRLARPDHLAGLTATYQAVTYVGFMASYPLAALGTVARPGVILLGVTALAVLTLLWTVRAASADARPRPGGTSGTSYPARS